MTYFGLFCRKSHPEYKLIFLKIRCYKELLKSSEYKRFILMCKLEVLKRALLKEFDKLLLFLRILKND